MTSSTPAADQSQEAAAIRRARNRTAVRWLTALTVGRALAGVGVAALVLWANAIVFSPIGFTVAGGVYASATILFVIAAATDAVDGWAARRFQAVTPLGAALDHAADKVLVTAALGALIFAALPFHLVVAALIILVRDVGVAGLREGLMAQGRALPVNALGKVKTIAEMVAITLLLALQAAALTPGASAAAAVLAPAGAYALWVAATLAVWSGGGYVLAATSTRDRL
jgi:CDP-diacylglycerol--glycerol-3-phosphate 3-phosphatidyltransferase